MATELIIENIAKDFNLSYHDFLEASARAYLEKKLRDIRASIYEIACKYRVESIVEFENLYREGKIGELETFNDYTRLDRLEFQKDKIQNLLKELS